MDEKYFVLYEEKNPQKALGILIGEDNFAGWVAQELIVADGRDFRYDVKEISPDEARSILERIVKSP